MTCTLNDYTSAEANEGRVARRRAYFLSSVRDDAMHDMMDLSHVVLVKTAVEDLVEIDAETFSHAVSICKEWVRNHDAMRADIHEVLPDGTLSASLANAPSYWS